MFHQQRSMTRKSNNSKHNSHNLNGMCSKFLHSNVKVIKYIESVFAPRGSVYNLANLISKQNQVK